MQKDKYPELYMRAKSIRPLQLLFAVFFVITVTIIIIVIVSFNSFRQEMIIQQSKGAIDHARVLAENFEISAEQFNRIKYLSLNESRIDPETIRFKKQAETLLTYRGVKYIYIISKLEDSEVRFSYDSPELAKEAGYPLGTPMNAVYVFTSEDESSYTEKDRYDYNFLEDSYGEDRSDWAYGEDLRWGTCLTGLYPFKTTNGTLVGYIGVDIGLQEFNNTMKNLNITLWVILIVIILMLIALFTILSIRLRSSLYRDALTGLINRNIYRDLILRRIDKQKAGIAAFYFFDLDGFKSVNDTLGHFIGDKLLIQFAKRLTGIAGRDSLVIRIAGDEFGIFKKGFKNINEVKEYGEKIVADISTQIWIIDGNKIQLSISAGCAVWDSPAKTVSELVEYADFAMYSAKSEGKSRLVMFDFSNYNMVENEQKLQKELASIIIEKHYIHVFQPIVDVSTGTVAGYEGLTRFTENNNDNILTSYMRIIGQGAEVERVLSYTLAETFRKLKGDRKVFLSINSSIEDIYGNLSKEEYRKYEQVFAGLDIIVEINDSSWAGVVKVLRKAMGTRAIGQRIALDNFVSGSCCSALLVGMNPDFIKISPDLIRDIELSEDVKKFISLTVRFAHKINCKVIAVGVETENSIRLLKKIGVDYMQGFIIGKPDKELLDVPEHVQNIILSDV